MCKLWNNFWKDGRNKLKRDVIVLSEEVVLSPAQVQGYLIQEKVLDARADMKATDYMEDLMKGKIKISQEEMYNYSKHLAMYLMVAYPKRPVVIQSMRLLDITKAHEDFKELVKQGKADENSDVYVTVKPVYDQTKFKTVSALALALTYAEFQVYKNYYYLGHHVQKAKLEDPLLLSKTGKRWDTHMQASLGRSQKETAFHLSENVPHDSSGRGPRVNLTASN